VSRDPQKTSANVKVAMILGAAIVIATWHYVRSSPERVCARILAAKTGESFDHALVRCAMQLGK
jgi:hypothetical protein